MPKTAAPTLPIILPRPEAVTTSHRFRPDIEGLRAVAVTLVVLSHAGIGRFEGGYVGVDVFFVISGFLITGLLLAEQSRTDRVAMGRFYARRALRLLPVSTVTVLATVAAAWLFLPATRFHGITVDALHSTFYGMNWRLAAQGVDYLAATAEPSPLQHLWSLAVEEQFYLVWPLLMIITFRSRRLLIGVLSTLVVASLAVSVRQTGDAAPWAYFGSHTRAWELGAGALLAVGATRLARQPRAVAVVLSWTGLAAVMAAAVLYTETTSFPGHAALLPVLGAGAIIAAGMRETRGSAGTLLGLRPMREIGKLSYGWYLWHWPALMIGPYALGTEPSPTVNLALAAGSLLLAFVTYHLVENPFRNSRPLRARARIGLATGLALSSVTALIAGIGGRHTPPLPTGGPAPSLAAQLADAPDPQARIAQLITASATATRMPSNLYPTVTDPNPRRPRLAGACRLDFVQVDFGPCAYGDTTAARTAFLVGDSHANHWFPAVDKAARNRGWRLIVLTKFSCQVPQVLVYNTVLKRPYRECAAWRDKVFARIRRERPQMVILASNDRDNGGIYDPAGQKIPTAGSGDDTIWAERWKQSFRELAGIPAVLLQDTTWPRGVAPTCLAVNARAISACNRPRQEAVAEPNRRALVAAVARSAGARVVDPVPWLCTDVCPPIIGDTLVHWDDSHLTVPFTEALTPLVERSVFIPAKRSATFIPAKKPATSIPAKRSATTK